MFLFRPSARAEWNLLLPVASSRSAMLFSLALGGRVRIRLRALFPLAKLVMTTLAQSPSTIADNALLLHRQIIRHRLFRGEIHFVSSRRSDALWRRVVEKSRILSARFLIIWSMC